MAQLLAPMTFSFASGKLLRLGKINLSKDHSIGKNNISGQVAIVRQYAMLTMLTHVEKDSAAAELAVITQDTKHIYKTHATAQMVV